LNARACMTPRAPHCGKYCAEQASNWMMLSQQDNRIMPPSPACLELIVRWLQFSNLASVKVCDSNQSVWFDSNRFKQVKRVSRHDRIVTLSYKTDKDDLDEAKTGGVSRMIMHCTNQCW
jgi:hypothetical protein